MQFHTPDEFWTCSRPSVHRSSGPRQLVSISSALLIPTNSSCFAGQGAFKAEPWNRDFDTKWRQPNDMFNLFFMRWHILELFDVKFGYPFSYYLPVQSKCISIDPRRIMNCPTPLVLTYGTFFDIPTSTTITTFLNRNDTSFLSLYISYFVETVFCLFIETNQCIPVVVKRRGSIWWCIEVPWVFSPLMKSGILLYLCAQ